MDTNVLQNILEKMVINDDLTLYVFDVINDRVDKYAVLLGEVKKEKTDTMQNYLVNIKNEIKPEFIKGFMGMMSVPKIKDEIKNGNTKPSFKYQSFDGNYYEILCGLANLNGSELIITVRRRLNDAPSKDMGVNNVKYDGLVRRLADSILKINNVFNLNNENTLNIKNVEEYINSILRGLISSYPDLKKSLNKDAANVTGMVDDVLLIVDDDMLTRNMIKKVFDGEYKTVMATNGKEAIDYLEANQNKGITESSDNVLAIFLDLTMPVMDGFGVLDYLSKNNYLYKVPVVIISGDYEKETKARVYNYGVADMLEKPFDFEVVRHRISNFINLYKSSNSLNNIVNDESRSLRELINSFVESYRYDYEENIKNVNSYIKILATQVMNDNKKYKLDKEKIEKMADASMYYDIGFYSVPRRILSKKEDFTKKELEKIKNYPIFGSKMLEYILSHIMDETYKKYAKSITLYYHENYDGTGYPKGLKEDEIPIEAMIAQVCITYNNLKRKKVKDPLSYFERKKGSVFNPEIVQSLKKVIDKFN